MIIFFFFFQAEDGIRDSSVTGVQTCALPILGADRRSRAEEGGKQEGAAHRKACAQLIHGSISLLFLLRIPRGTAEDFPLVIVASKGQKNDNSFVASTTLDQTAGENPLRAATTPGASQ